VLLGTFLVEPVEEPSARGGAGSEDFGALYFGGCPLF
jgi:hypothetical protein